MSAAMSDTTLLMASILTFMLALATSSSAFSFSACSVASSSALAVSIKAWMAFSRSERWSWISPNESFSKSSASVSTAVETVAGSTSFKLFSMTAARSFKSSISSFFVAASKSVDKSEMDLTMSWSSAIWSAFDFSFVAICSAISSKEVLYVRSSFSYSSSSNRFSFFWASVIYLSSSSVFIASICSETGAAASTAVVKASFRAAIDLLLSSIAETLSDATLTMLLILAVMSALAASNSAFSFSACSAASAAAIASAIDWSTVCPRSDRPDCTLVKEMSFK